MAWVRSEYAGELAVLSAWVAALLPWNVMYAPDVKQLGPVLYIRWPFLQVRYIFSLPPDAAVRLHLPAGALGLIKGTEPAYHLWIGGALVFALAFLLSVIMYVVDGLEEQALPDRAIRRLGQWFAAGALLTSALVMFLDMSRLTVWVAGTTVITATGLVWLDQTMVSDGAVPNDSHDGDPDVAGTDDDQEAEDEYESVSATDGGEREGEGEGEHGASISAWTAVLVGTGGIALSASVAFVATTMADVSWPSGWMALLGVSIPTVANNVMLLTVVALLVVGILFLSEELLERNQPALTVRVMGSLLGAGSLVFVGSTIAFTQDSVFGGIPIPIGMIVLLPLAWILLTVDLA
jgi:hypothetical protein